MSDSISDFIVLFRIVSLIFEKASKVIQMCALSLLVSYVTYIVAYSIAHASLRVLVETNKEINK